MELMKSWVDKTVAQGNIWLVLVFHGVDGVGWKPKTSAELKEYFGYINSKRNSVWVATFQDVAKYIRERSRSTVRSYRDGEVISIVLRSELTDELRSSIDIENLCSERMGSRRSSTGRAKQTGGGSTNRWRSVCPLPGKSKRRSCQAIPGGAGTVETIEKLAATKSAVRRAEMICGKWTVATAVMYANGLRKGAVAVLSGLSQKNGAKLLKAGATAYFEKSRLEGSHAQVGRSGSLSEKSQASPGLSCHATPLPKLLAE